MTNSLASFRRRTTSIGALFVAVATLLLVLLVPAGMASAHTSFEQSSPANGATISEPLGVITLQFSGDTEYSDDGFTVLTPDGHVRSPTLVTSADQRVFELTFDPPLAGGEVGVRWTVNAPDLHSIDGAFSFTVTAPASASVAPGAVGQTAAPAAADAMVMADGSTMDMSSASPSMDEFLAEQPTRSGQGTARWGRLIGLAAITLLIGGGAFAATTLRGRRAEIDRAVAILRILGITLAVGALLEYVGTSRIAEASIASYWSSQPGMATLLRGVGGLAVAAGLAAVTIPVRTARPVHSLSAAVNSTLVYERETHVRVRPDDDTVERPSVAHITAIDPLLHRHQQRVAHAASPSAWRNSVTISTSPPPREPERAELRDQPIPQVSHRHVTEPSVIRQWVLDRSSTAAYIGVAIAIMSFWFDGHTVSKGARPLHAILNSVHVIAGSIWLGGVVAMAVVLWSRHRAAVAPRALEMIVRFSGIATVALGAVIGAGGIMAILVLDSVGELFSTPWGQMLLLKSAAAALAMIGGAFNHFRLLPALEADPDDPRLVEHLRTAVTTEAILLGFVIVVTASLVAAAS